MDRDYHASAPLGRGHHSGLELPPWTPRTIRSERHRPPGPELILVKKEDDADNVLKVADIKSKLK
jgi:hypothetical protein